MPRDATATRAVLLRQAERLFAERGVHQATVREITQAAGQRNVSALAYHFGSREGILRAILTRHGDPLDVERGELLSEPLAQMTTRALLAALLVPYARRLGDEEGRDYLRIVAQLTATFPLWRATDLAWPNLTRVLDTLEHRVPGGDPATQRERVVNAVMLLTAAFAERARVVDAGRPPGRSEEAFVANLADMLVAGLDAPAGPPLPTGSPEGRRG